MKNKIYDEKIEDKKLNVLDDFEDVKVDEDSEELNDFDESDILEDLLSKLNNIQLNTDGLEDIKIDKKEFLKGVKQVSILAGMFSCLRSVGMDMDSASTFILNERNISHAQNIQELINKNQLEIETKKEINFDNSQI